jgi:hypothetical protein
MIRNIIVAIMASMLIIFVNLRAEVVHLPLLVILVSAMGLGYLQPQKGWILILLLIIGIFSGFLGCQLGSIQATKPSIQEFATYICPLPCLFGGFMGSYFNKTIHQK